MLIGGTSIEFVTEDGSRRIAVLSGEVRIDGVFYEVDKDILDELRGIVLGEECRSWNWCCIAEKTGGTICLHAKSRKRRCRMGLIGIGCLL